MKNRIKDYIDLIFADAPDCARTREMKEEMYANVCDRYDDLLRKGKSEAAAYNASIAGIGDISELIDSIKSEQGEQNDKKEDNSNPYSAEYAQRRSFTEEEKAEIKKYRVRSSVMNAVAVSMYILCWVPLVLIAVFFEKFGLSDEIGGVIGLTVMMLFIAIATALMIIKSSTKPLCLKGIKDSELDGDDDDDSKASHRGKKKNPILSAITGALWLLTVCAYLAVSFYSGAWHLTWLIFLITTAVDNIIEAIFEICGKRYI